MIEYWQGFEIDGSDTSFNIMLPEKARVAELGLFFCKLPLFRKVRLHIIGDETLSDLNEIEQHLTNENISGFTIDAECIHPAQLPDDLKEKIYILSENRKQRHQQARVDTKDEDTSEIPDHTKAVNPSVGLSDFPFEMSLTYEGHTGDDFHRPEGYTINPENYTANINLPENNAILYLHCPVSSIYEYFAYVVNTMAERFPEISVDGGLDCAGGFMYGCTYSTYLYEYECLTLKTGSDKPDSIKQLLEKLVATETVFPCVRKPVKYTSNYFPAENELTLINNNYSKPETMSFKTYVSFLTKEASSRLKDKMKCAALFLTEKDTDWKNYAQLTAYPENGQWITELYIKQHDRQKITERLQKAGIEYT